MIPQGQLVAEPLVALGAPEALQPAAVLLGVLAQEVLARERLLAQLARVSLATVLALQVTGQGFLVRVGCRTVRAF